MPQSEEHDGSGQYHRHNAISRYLADHEINVGTQSERQKYGCAEQQPARNSVEF